MTAATFDALVATNIAKYLPLAESNLWLIHSHVHEGIIPNHNGMSAPEFFNYMASLEDYRLVELLGNTVFFTHIRRVFDECDDEDDDKRDATLHRFCRLTFCDGEGHRGSKKDLVDIISAVVCYYDDWAIIGGYAITTDPCIHSYVSQIILENSHAFDCYMTATMDIRYADYAFHIDDIHHPTLYKARKAECKMHFNAHVISPRVGDEYISIDVVALINKCMDLQATGHPFYVVVGNGIVYINLRKSDDGDSIEAIRHLLTYYKRALTGVGMFEGLYKRFKEL